MRNVYEVKIVGKLRNMAWQIRAAWMFFASFFKREWTLDDYPTRIRFLPTDEPSQTSRLKLFPWTADIINWPGISGSANSRPEAIEALRTNFAQYKATKLGLPRPGTNVPIAFAANERVSQHTALAEDFVRRVLEMEWAWISDKSSLWDFHGDETNDRLIEKIRCIYGVNVSDISSGNLADIFDRISMHRKSTPAST
jgi:hypothetical protein